MIGDSTAIVWLDPGKLTGWARLDAEETFLSGQEEFNRMDELIDHWTAIGGPGLWLGWEMYIVTPGGGSVGTAHYSLEMIGAARSACRRHGTTVLRAMPSSARKLGDDAKLRKLGWYRPGHRHANDAANHLLAFLLRERLLPGHLARSLFTPG